MKKEKLYTITCNEEQLRLIANAVEDWSRFLSGQCEMWNATSGLGKGVEAREVLSEKVKPLITPELARNESYGWSGAHCKNDYQRNSIAMSYGIYRQIRHFFACQHPKDTWNVYLGNTLTCPEQGPLIKIEEKNKKEEA